MRAKRERWTACGRKAITCGRLCEHRTGEQPREENGSLTKEKKWKGGWGKESGEEWRYCGQQGLSVSPLSVPADKTNLSEYSPKCNVMHLKFHFWSDISDFDLVSLAGEVGAQTLSSLQEGGRFNPRPSMRVSGTFLTMEKTLFSFLVKSE